VGLAHKVDQLCEQDHQEHSKCELHGSKTGGSDEEEGDEKVVVRPVSRSVGQSVSQSVVELSVCLAKVSLRVGWMRVME